MPCKNAEVLQEFWCSCKISSAPSKRNRILARPAGHLPRGAGRLGRDLEPLPQKFLVYRGSADLLALVRRIDSYKHIKGGIQDSGNFADAQ